MGFFSRLFNLDDRSNVAPDEYEDEDAFDNSTTETILQGFDIDTAIAAHENWKSRLANYINGTSSEELDPAVVCRDDCCDLGKWLHSPESEGLKAYGAFGLLVSRHKFFHIQASTIVAHSQAGNKEAAKTLMEGSYKHASNQTVLLLKELRRGLRRT